MSIISAQNIIRRFGDSELEVTVLKGIDIEVSEGEFLAIMGKSGAGKSTLMYQLSVLDTPTSGNIKVANTDVMVLDENQKTAFRLNTLGYVFQNYALVPDLSAVENVMVPSLMRGLQWQEALIEAESAINAVGMPGKYHNLPAQLSGGEQQRISIARAIAGKPKILFADEPTANLDSVSSQEIIGLIKNLNQKFGLTVVMVTHERDYAEVADRIIFLEDGLIVKEEKVSTKRQSSKLYNKQ